MKWIYSICISVLFVLLSSGLGYSQELQGQGLNTRRNIFLDNRLELKDAETGKVLYLDKDFWRSDRYFLKDAETDRKVGQFKHNPWLDRWEYTKSK